MRRHYLLPLVALLVPATLAAQDSTRTDTRDSVITLSPIVVTATRDPRPVDQTPAPVSVVDSAALARRAPGNVSDLFLDLAGLDVNGVGPNQTRPSIRGQLGQRILLLEDGIRMNNSRRQQDFGELPSLVGVELVRQVEVVRGQASVLYGTDAIGGAVNLITRQPGPANGPTRIHGSLGYRFESAGDQQRPFGLLTAASGRLSLLLYGAYRDAGSYTAPGGTFGGLTLAGSRKVQDTGVRDGNIAAQLGVRLGDGQALRARYERYVARDAGFGFVRNGDVQPFDPNAPTIQIRYPDQSVDKLTLGYAAHGLGFALADRLDVTTYYVSNARRLTLDVSVPTGPGSSGQSSTHNFTDLDTWGFRIEAAKAVAGRHLLTYGVDGFHDRSTNTDTTSTTGFGPPGTSTTPQVPDATFRSLGAFVQADLHPAPRLEAIAGARLQDIRAATRTTPGITAPLVANSRQTVVGTLNLAYALTDGLSVVGTAGRGFRSPNLVERFFSGPTPEGFGYQSATPGLKPETSFDLDLGLRYRGHRVAVEAFAFRNEIHNGIRIDSTGNTVQGLPEFQNINVDRLRTVGLEGEATVALGSGFSLGSNATLIDSKDVNDGNNPVGRSYSFKLGGSARYDDPRGRFWLSYGVRHNGEQKDVAVTLSPVGSPVPGFTVQEARAGARLFRSGGTEHTVGVAVTNLTDRLYSEASNANFFRPAPGRSVTLSYRMDF